MLSAQSDTEIPKIGAYLQVQQSAIEWAMAVQREELTFGNVKPIGEILLEREEITYENLRSALQRQRIGRLRPCRLFADLSDTDLSWISESSEEVPLVTGQELFRQDGRGDSVYALLSGRLLIYQRQGHQEGIPVGVAVPGDFLGETDYFAHGNRGISACAIEPALVLKTRYEFLRNQPRFSPNPAFEVNEDPAFLPGIWPTAHSNPEPHAGAEALTRLIVNRAVRVMNADRAYLYLPDGATGDLFTRVVSGEESRIFRLPSGTEIAGHIVQTGDLVNLHEAYLDPRFNPAIDIWTGYWTRTLLAGPIRDAAGGIIGVVEAINKHTGFFHQDDQALLRAFTRHAANAVLKFRPTFG